MLRDRKKENQQNETAWKRETGESLIYFVAFLLCCLLNLGRHQSASTSPISRAYTSNHMKWHNCMLDNAAGGFRGVFMCAMSVFRGVQLGDLVKRLLSLFHSCLPFHPSLFFSALSLCTAEETWTVPSSREYHSHTALHINQLRQTLTQAYCMYMGITSSSQMKLSNRLIRKIYCWSLEITR